jgi:hypothetical protein
MGGETSSQDTAWVTGNVSSTAARLSPSHIPAVSLQQTTYGVDFHLPSTLPAEAAAYPSSHLGDYRLPT